MTLTDLSVRLNFPEPRASGLPRLIAMTDPDRESDPVALIERLPAAAAVIFRHYGNPDRDRLAAKGLAAANSRGVFFLVADDVRLAGRIGADGVHFPEYRIRRRDRRVRTALGRFPLVTAAAHSRRAALAAEKAGIDALILSPVFPTLSHSERSAMGPLRFALAARDVTVPVYALGGVAAGNARRLAAAGAYGLAGIGLFSVDRNG